MGFSSLIVRYGAARVREWFKQGDRVATIAWNNHRHFEIYFAVPGIGAVCHTINPRLFGEQIAYIANHAEDTFLFLDLTFVPLVEGIAAGFTKVKGYVLMCGADEMPDRALRAIRLESAIDPMRIAKSWPPSIRSTN